MKLLLALVICLVMVSVSIASQECLVIPLQEEELIQSIYGRVWCCCSTQNGMCCNWTIMCPGFIPGCWCNW